MILIFPPAFYPHMPYLALPSIKAFLEINGLRSEVRDYNVLFYRQILKKQFVEECYNKIVASPVERLREGDINSTLLTGHEDIPFIFDHLERAIASIDGIEDGYDFSDSIDYSKIIDLALMIISDAFYPLDLNLSDLEMSHSYSSSSEVKRAIEDRTQNIFISYFENELDDFNDASNEPFGISITAQTQIIPAFTLCRLIREKMPERKIILGGEIVTRLASIFKTDNCLSSLYDDIIIFEGEERLLKYLSGNEGNGKAIGSAETITDITSLPSPNFEDLPLTQYFDKNLILSIQASRRCYWGKCKFCDIPYGYDSIYRHRDAKQIVDEIEYLKEKYQTRYFKFIDDAVHPILMREISEEILKRNISINWEVYAILEKQFMDEELVSTISAAGCKWLYFGFESGDKSIVSSMTKRSSFPNVSQILSTTAVAGIKNHLWVMFGFPGEKLSNYENTLSFIEANKSNIHSIEVNQFSLTKHSAIFQETDYTKYHFKPIIEENQDLALLFDYTTEDGFIDQHHAKELVYKLRDTIEQESGLVNAVRSSNIFYDD